MSVRSPHKPNKSLKPLMIRAHPPENSSGGEIDVQLILKISVPNSSRECAEKYRYIERHYDNLKCVRRAQFLPF